MFIPALSNLFIILILLSQIIFSIIYSLILIPAGLNYSISLVLSQLFSFILPIFLYCMAAKQSPLAVVRFKKISMVNILFVIGLALLIQPAAMLVSALTNLVFPNMVPQALDEIGGHGSFIIVVITTCVVPAICEEIALRGAAAQNLTHLGLKGVLLNGLYFGIIHLNFHQFFYAFLLGMLLFFMLKATGSILAPMLAHFSINCTSPQPHWLKRRYPPVAKIIPSYRPHCLF